MNEANRLEDITGQPETVAQENTKVGDAVRYTDVAGVEHAATVERVHEIVDLLVIPQDEAAGHKRPRVPRSSDGTSQPGTWRHVSADER